MPLCGLGGEQVRCLGHQLGLQVAGPVAEGAHDRDVEPSGAEGRVGDVDDLVPGGVQRGDGGAQGHGLARADVPGDDAERGLEDAEADPGDRLGVGLPGEQVLRRDGLAERGAGQAEVGGPRRRAHCSSPAAEHGQPGEVDLRAGAGLLVVGGGDQAEVVDPGRRRAGPGGLGNGAVHVPADDEWHRVPGGPAVQPDVDAGQVLGVVAQLDPPPRERGIHGIGVALEGNGRGAGDLAGHRPAERLRAAGPGRPGGAARPSRTADRGLPGLGVRPPVGDLPGPRGEQVVELLRGSRSRGGWPRPGTLRGYSG